MQAQENKPGWYVWGVTVMGASHQRAGTKNQDAIGWKTQEKDCPDGYILAVADGHGSPRSPRSADGSRFAVQVLLELAHDYIKEVKEGITLVNPFSLVKQQVEQKLPQDLIRLWQERVEQDLSQLTVKSQSTSLEDGLEQNSPQANYLLYGSTILGVMLTSHYVVYIQLGDGDILTVSERGEVSRPFLRDPRLLANQTTSLATTSLTLNTLSGSPSYASDVYIKFEFFQNDPPALILVSTDGYSNSYRDNKAFEQIGPDYLKLLKAVGLAAIKENLEGWLNETSQTGSGDDITLGLMIRADILPASEGEATAIMIANEVEPEKALAQSEPTAQEVLIQTPPEETVE